MNHNSSNEITVNIPLHRSFLGKLLFFMLLIGILPLMVNAIVSYNLGQNALEQATNETQSIIAKNQSAYMLNWANERMQDIVTLSGISGISSMNRNDIRLREKSQIDQRFPRKRTCARYA